MTFLESIRLDSFLSFAPGTASVALRPLNVLIGPNASGKSNVIEALELLRATPTGFASAIRDGGGARDWLWKGEGRCKDATIEVDINQTSLTPPLRYRLRFAEAGQRTEVVDEALEERTPRKPGEKDVFFYYRFQAGRPAINVREVSEGHDGRRRITRHLERQSLVPDESVLSQRRDPDLYPELTWVALEFSRIQTFREWSFGRYAPLRQPQPADLPTDRLLPDSRNLGLLLNHIEHSDAGRTFDRYLQQFLPRYRRLSTRVDGGTVQFFLHEDGLEAPVPATRLSDGTIRFLAMLALLLWPTPPPLVCLEEPELGLHPDAVSLFGELLVDAATRTQLVVTTHSDALVSALTEHSDSVLVCEYLGGSRLERLDPDKLRFWLDKYRLGEIWRIGEIGGNP
jgi:predicted ATPase